MSREEIFKEAYEKHFNDALMPRSIAPVYLDAIFEAMEEYSKQKLEEAISNITTSCNYYEKEVNRNDYSAGFKKSILLISQQIEEINKP